MIMILLPLRSCHGSLKIHCGAPIALSSLPPKERPPLCLLSTVANTPNSPLLFPYSLPFQTHILMYRTLQFKVNFHLLFYLVGRIYACLLPGHRRLLTLGLGLGRKISWYPHLYSSEPLISLEHPQSPSHPVQVPHCPRATLPSS